MKLFLTPDGVFPHRTADLLDRHDLVFLSPVPDPFYGLPIGDGQSGFLLWTDERRLFVQINDTGLIDDHEVLDDGHTSASDEKNTVCVNGARLTLDFGEPVFEAIYQERYEARLSLKDARVRIDAETPFRKAAVEAFAPEAYRTGVLHIETNGDDTLPLSLELERWGSRTFMYWYSALAGTPRDGLSGSDAFAENGTLFVTQDLAGLSFCVACRLKAAEETAFSRRSPHAVSAEIGADKHHAVDLFLTVTSALTAGEAVEEAVRRLDRAAKTGVERMREEHRLAWESFWNASFVALPPEDDFLENLWYLNLYYANCQNKGLYPPHFCNGVWGSYHDFVPWNLYFHYNTQQGIFPLDPAGHPELTETYYRFRASQLPQAMDFAREVKEADGAFFTDVCDMKGRMAVGTRFNCTCGAQIALSAYSHYLYTGDEDFLESTVKPLIRETAAYYLAVLKRESDGLYHIYDTQGYEGSPLMDDSITDLTAVRALFRTASDLFPDDVRYPERLEHLAPFETLPFENDELDGEGKLVYGIGAGRMPASGRVLSVGRAKDGKRLRKTYGNPVHEYYGFPDTEMAPVFPSGLVGIKDRGSELYDLIRNSILLHHRIDRNPQNAEGTEPCGGWCMMPLYLARMGLIEDLWPFLRQTASTWLIYPQGFGTYSSSFLDQKFRLKNPKVELRERDEVRKNLDQRFRHFDYETLPILAAALNESLLQSYDGTVRLFPAVRPDQSLAFSLRAAGGFEVRALYDRGRFEASVVSTRGGKLRLVVDQVEGPFRIAPSGELLRPGEIAEIDTAPGQTILLRSAGALSVEKDVSRNEDAKSLDEAWLGIGKEFSL